MQTATFKEADRAQVSILGAAQEFDPLAEMMVF